MLHTFTIQHKMTASPKHNISTNRAMDLLLDGHPLLDVFIDGEIRIENSDAWGKEVVIENSILNHFSGSNTQFEKSVRLINCHFKKCQFTFAYFLGGLVIDNCTFDSYLDLQAGGHNKAGNAVTIINNEFADFVNFFDCIYEQEVTVSSNKFHKGTNLLGKPFNIPVSFGIPPIIGNNSGQLDFDHEGDNV